MTVTVEASTVLALTQTLTDAGADWCIVGGWGVDALLGEQTRAHKDLDVFVQRDHLNAVLRMLHRAAFRRTHTWEESRPLDAGGPCPAHDSALVMSDGEGCEVDIHVYALRAHAVEPLWETRHSFQREDLDARGVIAGFTVRCITAVKQLETHSGYALPTAHREDVERLQSLLATKAVTRAWGNRSTVSPRAELAAFSERVFPQP